MIVFQRIQRICFTIAIGIFVLPLGQAIAQDVPTLTDQQKSVVVFDFRIARFNEDAKALGLETEGLDAMPMEDFLEGVKPSELKRVYGSASLPDKLEKLTQAGSGEELPMELFVRIEFTNANACQMFVDNVSSGGKEVEVGGKKFWAPDGGLWSSASLFRCCLEREP